MRIHTHNYGNIVHIAPAPDICARLTVYREKEKQTNPKLRQNQCTPRENKREVQRKKIMPE